MSQQVIEVNPEKCTGCRMCEMACSLVHEGSCSTILSRVKILKIAEIGVDMPVLCMHCIDAPCIPVCPVNAITRDPDTNATMINKDICIGCRACNVACPFGATPFNEEKGEIIRCDLCDGDPACVKFCEPDALKFVEIDREAADRRRKVVNLYAGRKEKAGRGAEVKV